MEIGKIRPIDIDQEMRESYLDYAMSVIVARALPDVRDGLKPVHRRILWAMYQMGLRHTSEYKKSARIVGEVLGKYHPHGDLAVYDALVRLAQEFNMRYSLVDGQGNFGSVDGDSPAAMRYTEAKLSAIAEEMLADIDKDTVDFIPNFDGSEKEPVVLPARLPNLLLMGASGIAVGMATNIPTHNLAEVADGLIYLLEHYDRVAEISPEDLLKYIPGPDFPTGGFIVGADGIRQAYATGKGIVIMRAKAHIEEVKGSRQRIVVSEIPYQVNKANLIERIADLVRDKKIEDISDLRDESDRRGMSIVIELKRGAQPEVVLNQLFKFTSLQTTFGVNMLALVDGEPRVLTLKGILLHYLNHRQTVITRRTKFLLDRAKERAHILEGLRIALKNLDAVIATIRKAKSAEDAQKDLVAKFKLTSVQAQAILDIQLRRLAALERQKIEDEYQEITAQIKELSDLLAHPQKILGVIKSELQELKKKYRDNRRTVILAEAEAEIDVEALVPEEDVLVALSQRGYIKRVAVESYRAQKRGGKGVTGMATREEDAVQHLFLANTKDTVLFFTNQGRVFQEKAYQIPDASRQARGLPINNLLALAPKEAVTAAFAVSSFDQGKYLVLATRKGKIKRTEISEFQNIRSSGIMAMTLEDRDELGWVKLTKGPQDLILITAQGQAIRFSEDEVRPMSRTAGGVMGIALSPGDEVATLEVVDPKGYLLVMTEKGFGKKTLLGSGKEKDTSKVYSRQKRHGQGIRTISRAALEETGKVVAAKVVQEEDELTVISTDGFVLRTAVAQISTLGRDTRGVKVMDLRPDDSVASLARIEAQRQNKVGVPK